MQLSKFQKEVQSLRSASQTKVQYPAFRLLSESGAVSRQLASAIESGRGRLSELHKSEIITSLGHLLVSASMLATDLGINLNELATDTILKYKSKKTKC